MKKRTMLGRSFEKTGSASARRKRKAGRKSPCLVGFGFMESLLLCDAVKKLSPTQEELVPGKRGRRVKALIQLVGRQDFQLVRTFEHNRRALAVGEVNASVRADG